MLNPIREDIEKFIALVKSRTDRDVFTPRTFVTLQGEEIDKLITLLDDYWALVAVSSIEEEPKDANVRLARVDMVMPMSCKECPIRDSVYKTCPLVPGVPSWQVEIMDECDDKRSEHCPLREVE